MSSFCLLLGLEDPFLRRFSGTTGTLGFLSMIYYYGTSGFGSGCGKRGTGGFLFIAKYF